MEQDNRPKICRISKLKGFDGLVAGRDFADVLEDGHVYSASKVGGVIMLTDLGEHAIIQNYEGSSYRTLMGDGAIFVTKKELEEQHK